MLNNLSADNNFKKNTIWNFFGASFNAFNSLFFMIIVTRINGVSDSGVFTLAFSLACLLCIIGGYEGRVFQVTDTKEEFNDREYIIHRFITFILMMIVAFFYTFAMGYSTYRMLVTVLLCLLKGLEVLADVFYGVLQKNNKLFIVGISLTAKSVLSVLVFLAINLIFSDLVISCVAMCIVWLVIFIFYDVAKTKMYIDSSPKADIKKIILLFKSGFFTFSVLFLSVYLINAPKYALDGNVSESLQAVYGIILMPATVIGLCAQYLLQPFLPRLSNSYKFGEKGDFMRIIRFMFMSIVFIGVICLAGAYLFGIPVLNIVYGIQLDQYLEHLLIIIVGAVFYALGMLLSTALTTIRYTFVQFIIYLVTSVFGLIVSTFLIREAGIYGAAFAYLLIMFLQFIQYLIWYSIILRKVDFTKGQITNAEN